MLCEPQTLAAPFAVMQTAVEQAVCLPSGGGVAPERASVVYRSVSVGATDSGRVLESGNLQGEQGVSPIIYCNYAMHHWTGRVLVQRRRSVDGSCFDYVPTGV